MLQQGAGNGQPLLLAAGHVDACLAQLGLIAFGEGGDEIVGAGRFGRRLDLLPGGVGLAPAQVVFDGAGKEQVVLEHHGHAVPQVGHAILPHVPARHQHLAGGDVVEPGDELHQSGLGGTGAAQDAHGHAAFYLEIDIGQGQVLRVLAVGKVHVAEFHGTVLRQGRDLARGEFLVPDVRHLVQAFADTLDGGAGDDQQDEDHGQHHQGHQDLADVGDEGDEVAGEHGAGDDLLAAEPQHGHDAGVGGGHHDRSVADDDPLRPHLGVAHLIGGVAEDLALVVFPHEGFDEADAHQALLHRAVHVVVDAQHLLEAGMGRPGHAEEDYGQHGDGHQEDRGQAGVGGHHHDGGRHQHEGGPHHDADAHHEGHLGVVHVHREPGDEGGGGKAVDIGEGIVLQLVEKALPQVAGKAGAGHGGKAGRSRAAGQSQHGHEHHAAAGLQHVGHVQIGHAHVDDVRHHAGDEDLQHHFGNDHHHTEDGVLAEALYVREQFFQHRVVRSFLRDAIKYITAYG